MINLSKRLSAVASMVTEGNIVADIGTDHGYVPIYLVKNRICPKAYAMDVNKGPLEKAEEHVKEEGLEDSIVLIQSDGMKCLENKKVDTVVVAGMGGELVCKIIEESPVLEQVKELVLSPHSEVEKVRRKVIEKGFNITDEKMIVEYGKYYNIIKAQRQGQTDKYSRMDYIFSKKLFENKDDVFYEYLLKLQDKYKNIIELLNKSEKGVSKRNFELRQMLEDCQEAISKYEANA